MLSNVFVWGIWGLEGQVAESMSELCMFSEMALKQCF